MWAKFMFFFLKNWSILLKFGVHLVRLTYEWAAFALKIGLKNSLASLPEKHIFGVRAQKNWGLSTTQLIIFFSGFWGKNNKNCLLSR